jgi:Na+/melibiose symporter-like transporter
MEASRNTSMTRNPQQRRSPEEIRAGSRRLGLILFAIAAAFFVAAIIKQAWFAS